MKRPVYDHRPIGTVQALARALGVDARILLYVSNRSSKYFVPGKKLPKSDGTFRQTYRALEPLKGIQKRILSRILRRTDFPEYLLGGIRGGSPAKNAFLHSAKTLLIGEDIESFFPSVSVGQVKDVWQYFFNFPPAVAEILANLTTYDNSLPQGACTSTYLANLVFFDTEPILYERLRRRGLTYSRYVDDANSSTMENIPLEKERWAQEKIQGLFKSRGLRPKASKSASYRQNQRMILHNLTVNGRRPAISKGRMVEFRTTVDELEQDIAKEDNVTETFRKRLASIEGKVNYWRHLQPKKAKSLFERIRMIKAKITKIG